MRHTSHNPASNTLPQSIDYNGLLEAIDISGYPLQGIVASKFAKHFNVEEEWGYIDRDTGQHRSADVCAMLVHNAVPPFCSDAVLLECKRSKHPYVFFKSLTQGGGAVPMITGVPSHRITLLQTGDASKQVRMDVRDLFGLSTFPFVSTPPLCSSFARATPSGKRVELSGDDFYASLILPLVKAADHMAGINRTAQKQFHKSCVPESILLVAVVDAPLILVESPNDSKNPIMCPWLRVARSEAPTHSDELSPYRRYGIDVVHADYLDSFLSNYLMPFLTAWQERVKALHGVLERGGEVDDIDNWKWDSVRARS